MSGELLLDKLEMAQKALQWLAVDTYEPILQYYLHPHFEILLLCAHYTPASARLNVGTPRGVLRADIRYEQLLGKARFRLKFVLGERIANLRVRMPSEHGYLWVTKTNVGAAQITAHQPGRA